MVIPSVLTIHNSVIIMGGNDQLNTINTTLPFKFHALGEPCRIALNDNQTELKFSSIISFK